MAIANLEGFLILCNERWISITTMPHNQISKVSIPEIVVESGDQAKLLEALGRLSRGEISVFELKTVLKSADEQTFEAQLSLSTVPMDSPIPIRMSSPKSSLEFGAGSSDAVSAVEAQPSPKAMAFVDRLILVVCDQVLKDADLYV
jgi:hypothetical protein